SDSLRQTIKTRLDRVNGLMSTYDPNSELSRFNDSSSGAPFQLSNETVEVLEIARSVGTDSEGSFEVTVGPLVDLYGFGPDGRPDSPPGPERIREVLDYVGPDTWSLRGDSVVKHKPKARIDLSAVAKGYAVDEVARTLEGNGFRAYLVEVGGEVRASGFKADGTPFRVGIEEPVEDSRRVHAVLGLTDGSLATSGNYRNVYEQDGVRYVHTIDPKTGKPVAHRLLSASVVHNSCAIADAWATALMAAGDEAWALAQRNSLDVLLIYAGADGTLEEKSTKAVDAIRLESAPALAEK
ncbi:MAG: FAD:protein FMN transferase, partial [Myxococcota bacterium]